MIRFEGFGLNWRTGLLVALVALMLAQVLLIAKPAILPQGSKASAAVVWPCDPHGWQSRYIGFEDNPVGFRVRIEGRIRWNGCQVEMTEGPWCYEWWGGLAPSEADCSYKRLNLQTAYGQNLLVRGYWTVFPIGLPFGLGVPHYLCKRFDRNGDGFAYAAGPFAGEQCGYPSQTK